MAWKSRGVRGNALEELITMTNEFYQKKNLARIDKVPTPIKIIEQGSDGMIQKAFYEKKSTVDFIGFAQGVGIVFDAKETALSHLPFKNIHPHQIEYMKDITHHGGMAFIIVHFKKYNRYHLLPFETLYHFFLQASKGGRQSIPYSDFNPLLEIPYTNNGLLNYLKVLNVYNRLKTEDLL
jgi:recombination protein U